MVSKPMLCSPLTVVSFDFSQRIFTPVSMPLSSVTRELQKMVGQPSFLSSGFANSSKVSERMTVCVVARSSSINSFAPGSGSICAMTS